MMLKCVFNSEHSIIQAPFFFGRFNRSMDLIWPQVFKYDLRRDEPELEVPVHFVQGMHDMDTVTSLVEEYYSIQKAREKHLYIFDDSAHMAPFEEPERFCRIMGKIVSGKGHVPSPG